MKNLVNRPLIVSKPFIFKVCFVGIEYIKELNKKKMQVLEVAEGVILSRLDSFNMNQIITSGQCFRWNEFRKNVWRGLPSIHYWK